MKTTPCPIRQSNRSGSVPLLLVARPVRAASRSRLLAGKPIRLLLIGAVSLLGGLPWFPAAAATLHVWQGSPNPTPPFADWATAAHTIQRAVNAAQVGDTVLVTNGAYATGGKAVFGTMTNRVAVDKPVRVESVNGPAATVIQGYQVPGTTNGHGAIRCVYLTNGALLSGFTLTNGATLSGWDLSHRNDSGGGVWCESTDALVTNCTITGNSAGGASGGTLNNCTITRNRATSGGGASGSTLSRCTLIGNWALSTGGGAYYCTLNNCTLRGNSAQYGGGVSSGTLRNCTITGNSAHYGGGTYSGALNNCTLSDNSASLTGGGAYYGTLNNCTLTDNSATSGGGTSGATLKNCIVYYNISTSSGAANCSGGDLDYCCTTPLPTNGIGNISAEPQLASSSHLSADSPCRGAGSIQDAAGVDIDGEPWANPPSIGCDEYSAGTATGPLSVGLQAAYTNVAVGFELAFTGQIEGRASANRWNFGDGTVVSNRLAAQHAWTASGDYTVRLRAYNEDHPTGVSATLMVRVVAPPVHHVAADSTSPVSPYTNWATAARTIQEAVNAATVPGALVLVSNGTYVTGGKAVHGTLTNRVAVDKPVRVESANGPAVTVIEGYQVPGTINGDGAVRCAYLTNGAVLSGFTLSHGATQHSGDPAREQGGGGLWSESTNALVTNCTITGNSAYRSGGGVSGGTLVNCRIAGNLAQYGGGVSGGTLNQCTLTGNSATNGGGAYEGTLNRCTIAGNSAQYGGGASGGALSNCTISDNTASSGGGAYEGTLHHCTLTGNSADKAGGASESTLKNCIVYYNTARSGAANCSGGSLDYCCTTPLPATGTGNISAEPQLASASHLAADSPCRSAGSAQYAAGLDIDGEAWANPPSIGCDEYSDGTATGSLSVGLHVAFTNVTVGFELAFTGQIDGWASANRWNFGDGTGVSNRLVARHAWMAPGDYPVRLQAYNEDHPTGVSAMVVVRVVKALIHYVTVDSAAPVAPYTNWATAARTIQKAVNAAAPGARVLVTNGVYATGGKAVYGTMTNRVAVDKPVRVESVNGPAVTVIQGYQVPGTTNGDGAIRCVYLTNGAVLSGFTLTHGATRDSGGGVWCESTDVLVTNCTLTGNSARDYGGGACSGTLDYCTLADNSATYGGGAYEGTLHHCTLLGNSATYGGGASGGTLNTCSFTGNSAYYGGGAYYGTLNYCALIENSATGQYGSGGGACGGTLNHCTLTGNSANYYGGGASGGTLNHCTLSGNSAYSSGGGASWGTLNNCIVYYNINGYGPANYSGGSLNHCCTTPLPGTGTGNINAEPLFVDRLKGNLRLQSNSPCINAGASASVTSSTDLDGQPRIVGGTVDIGAYEFQNPSSVLSYAWLQQYGLPTDGSADSTDPDSDNLNNWQEWLCGTDPTNALSVLCLFPPAPTLSGVTLSWRSIANRTYFLECSTNLAARPAFLPLVTGLPGQRGMTTFTDTNISNPGPRFYRVGTQP